MKVVRTYYLPNYWVLGPITVLAMRFIIEMRIKCDQRICHCYDIYVTIE